MKAELKEEFIRRVRQQGTLEVGQLGRLRPDGSACYCAVGVLYRMFDDAHPDTVPFEYDGQNIGAVAGDWETGCFAWLDVCSTDLADLIDVNDRLTDLNDRSDLSDADRIEAVIAFVTENM